MASSGQFLVLLLIVASAAASLDGHPIDLETYSPTTLNVTWHEEVDEYPYEDAETLLATLEHLNMTRYFLNPEQIRKTPKHEDGNFTNLCFSTKRRIFPRSVDVEDKKYYLFNPKSRDIQYLDVEECDRKRTPNEGNEGQTCRLVHSNIGYTTECVQEYITRTVYLMTDDTPRRLKLSVLPIKSCCSCYSKYY